MFSNSERTASSAGRFRRMSYSAAILTRSLVVPVELQHTSAEPLSQKAARWLRSGRESAIDRTRAPVSPHSRLTGFTGVAESNNFTANAPCVTAAPARRAAASRAASVTSSRLAPALLAARVCTSRQ